MPVQMNQSKIALNWKTAQFGFGGGKIESKEDEEEWWKRLHWNTQNMQMFFIFLV